MYNTYHKNAHTDGIWKDAADYLNCDIFSVWQ